MSIDRLMGDEDSGHREGLVLWCLIKTAGKSSGEIRKQVICFSERGSLGQPFVQTSPELFSDKWGIGPGKFFKDYSDVFNLINVTRTLFPQSFYWKNLYETLHFNRPLFFFIFFVLISMKLSMLVYIKVISLIMHFVKFRELLWPSYTKDRGNLKYKLRDSLDVFYVQMHFKSESSTKVQVL